MCKSKTTNERDSRGLESNLLSLSRNNCDALSLGCHQRSARLGSSRRLPLLAPCVLLLALRLGPVGVKVPGGSRASGGFCAV